MNLNELRQNYGIYIIALWAIILGLQNFSTMLVLSSSVGVGPEIPTPTILMFYQGVSILFSFAFLAAAVGLVRRTNWGRLLFLVTVVLFFAVSMVGLFMPQFNAPSQSEQWLFGTRYTISTILPLAYLNLPNVRGKFVL